MGYNNAMLEFFSSEGGDKLKLCLGWCPMWRDGGEEEKRRYSGEVWTIGRLDGNGDRSRGSSKQTMASRFVRGCMCDTTTYILINSIQLDRFSLLRAAVFLSS